MLRTGIPAAIRRLCRRRLTLPAAVRVRVLARLIKDGWEPADLVSTGQSPLSLACARMHFNSA